MSGFNPINKKILVKPNEAPSMSEGGIHIPENAKEKQVIGTVIAAAKDCEFIREDQIVMYGKFLGTTIPMDISIEEDGEEITKKEDFLILNEKDILGYFDPDEESEESEETDPRD